MVALSDLIHARVRDPRLRLLLVVLLLLVVFVMLALAWHLVGMADRGMMMLGACVATLAAVVLLLGGTGRKDSIRPFRATALRIVARPPDVLLSGRHPPDEGTVLLD